MILLRGNFLKVLWEGIFPNCALKVWNISEISSSLTSRQTAAELQRFHIKTCIVGDGLTVPFSEIMLDKGDLLHQNVACESF